MKRTLAWMLCVALMLMYAAPGMAHDSQAEHDRDLKLVLFGNSKQYLRGPKYDAFRAIADAAALCIDQYSANENAQSKKKEFEDLCQRVNLSMSFEDIDLNRSIGNQNITPSIHRMYTHKGWNFSEYPDKEFWKVRQNIMLETVQQKIFSKSQPVIPWLSNALLDIMGPGEQCNAFCALIYYVHILGDHLEGDKPDKLTALEPLAQYEDLSSPGIIPELQEYLQVLFVDQRNSRIFMSLMQELDSLGRKAEKVYYSWGGINTEEKCKTNQANAKELLTLLGDNIPKLLSNEKFFTKVFPKK